MTTETTNTCGHPGYNDSDTWKAENTICWNCSFKAEQTRKNERAARTFVAMRAHPEYATEGDEEENY